MFKLRPLLMLYSLRNLALEHQHGSAEALMLVLWGELAQQLQAVAGF